MDKHKWIRRKRNIGSVLIAIVILFCTTFQSFAAETYYEDSKNKSFYTSDEDKIKTIFQTDLGDIANPFEWIMNKKTFVVFKETKDKSGNDFIKGYYNAPNPQTFIKNLALSDVSDGYTDNTYDVNESEWLVKVGKNAQSENVITKYGFHIPSYAYMGEYPRIRMDFSEAAPSGIFSAIWRGVKTLFGGSFISAPNSDEYKTLLYYNHTYLDNDQDILDFFKKNYLQYFDRAISTNEFKSPKHLINSSFSPEAVAQAEEKNDDIDKQLEANDEERAEYISELKEDKAFEYREVQEAFKDYLKQNKKEVKKILGKNPEPTYATYNKLKAHFVSERRMYGLTAFYPKVHIKTDEYTLKANALKNDKESNEKTVKDADEFKQKLENDAASLSDKNIAYTQCLIFSPNDDDCTSKKYGEPTTLAVMNVYAYSGLYKHTKHYKSNQTELSDEDTRIILQSLQTYCGPYYREVVANMALLMQRTAKAQGKDIALKTHIDDPREMPYDTAQMLYEDKQTFNVQDPRVELFRSHVFGTALADFNLDLGKNKLIYVMPQRLFINFSGTLCEMAVFFQQLCNFKAFEDAGLSPANLWKSGIVTFAILFILLLFIFKTVAAIINFIRGKQKPLKTIIVCALVLFLELGFVTMMTTNPERTWEVVKKPITTAIDFGELSATYAIEDDIKSLFGDDEASRSEVIRYVPYLDAWSQFNTGYSLFDKAQVIDKEKDTQELNAYKDVKIADKPIQHYAVLLADSFSYYGQSTSIQHSFKDSDGKVYNGKVINNNAYRVVDHFMAPKITKTKVEKDGKQGIQVKVTANPNYNGEYQKGFVTLLSKLLINLFNFYTAFVKFLIFTWFWYKLYIFVMNIILDRQKGWLNVLSTTFAPLLGLVVLSFISTVMILSLMRIKGLVALIAVIVCFVIYTRLLKLWEQKYEASFPKTLLVITYITSIREKLRQAKDRMSMTSYREEMRSANFEATDEELEDLDAMYDKLYDGKGERRYANDKMYKPYIERLQQAAKNGRKLTAEQEYAIKEFKQSSKTETSDKIKKEE